MRICSQARVFEGTGVIGCSTLAVSAFAPVGASLANFFSRPPQLYINYIHWEGNTANISSIGILDPAEQSR